MDFVMVFFCAAFGLFSNRKINRVWRQRHQSLSSWLDNFWGIVGGIVGGSAGGSVFAQLFPLERVRVCYFWAICGDATVFFSFLGAIAGGLLLPKFGLWLSYKTSKDTVFWLKWMVASVGSLVIAEYFATAIGDRTSLTTTSFLFSAYWSENILASLIMAFTLGIAQWTILQAWISLDVKKYVLAISISYILAPYLSGFVAIIISLLSFGLFSEDVASAFVFGAVVGFAQWLVLRAFLVRSRWVFFSNILGWVLAGFLMPYIDRTLVNFIIFKVGGSVVISSAVTGSTLAWLLSYKNKGTDKSVSSRQIEFTHEISDLESPQQASKTSSVDLQQALEKLQTARRQHERIGELRHLDIQIAEAFLLYVSIQWSKNYRQPTGIPRTDYDHHHFDDNRFRENIPRYSTNQSDYSRIERSVIGSGLRGLFLQILVEENLNEASATLEQKCRVWLKARGEERKRRTNK